MNQILQTGNNEKHNKTQNIKDLILFFIIVIVVFGLIFGAYLVIKNIINEKPVNPPVSENVIQTPEYVPTITLTRTEDHKLIINVESEIELSKITYSWNKLAPQTIELDGKTNIEKTIDIPFEENTIYISVIDINQKETTKEEVYVREIPKPQIELSVVGNDIKITITSEVELSEVSYIWNSGTENKENMKTYEDKNNFEKKLEIPIGKNELKVIAVDKDGGRTEKVQEIKGITKAKTTTNVQDGYWHFTVKGKENIKTVEFEFNGKKYIMNTNTFGTTKTVHYKVKLVEGKNTLKITSTTESDGVDTTSWEQQYTTE